MSLSALSVSMSQYRRPLLALLVFAMVAGSCARRQVNIDEALVSRVIAEFTEARLAYYLNGGSPVTNAELLEKVLSRHSLRLIEFKPVLRRFEPQLEEKLLKS